MLDAACLMLTTTFLVAGCSYPIPPQVIKEKLLLKADCKQWALSLGLQGDASGQFNDARMYQPREVGLCISGFCKEGIYAQLVIAHCCTQLEVTAPIKRGREAQ